MKDNSYISETTLGKDCHDYLISKQKRLTKTSLIDYEGSLSKFAKHFNGLTLQDFEPPNGTILVEEFLNSKWGHLSPSTYNKALSTVSDFFHWHILRQNLHGDPTLSIERARKRQFYRTTFSSEERKRIIESNNGCRDRIALRLLLNYGIRKGALQKIQIKHFDYENKILTIFSKGEKIQALPIPHDELWDDFFDLFNDSNLEDYLLPKQRTVRRAKITEQNKILREEIASLQRQLTENEKEEYKTNKRISNQPMGQHGLHDWWYRCLYKANIVEKGIVNGQRMHKARHTAGQHLLNKTGNLKAVQRMLGHATINTTADIYTDWSIEQLSDTLAEIEVA